MVMCVRTWHSPDMLWTLIYPSMAILTSISEDHFEEQIGTQENSWHKVGMELKLDILLFLFLLLLLL